MLRSSALASSSQLSLPLGRAIERIRVEAARQVLEQGLPVKRVAARCGFGSEETMRRSFLRLLGATPQAYRERFSSN
jgi:transcriptional regulator GlxA family with amidase domain